MLDFGETIVNLFFRWQFPIGSIKLHQVQSFVVESNTSYDTVQL